MSKFKVGDKVKRGRYEGIITDIKTKTTYTMTTEREGTYSNLSGKDLKLLKPYKTPHQELLDLGWVVLNKANGVLTYLLNADGSLHPEIIELSLEGKRYYTTLRIIDLQLAKILVRYLEELE